jgi:hypothetical protein
MEGEDCSWDLALTRRGWLLGSLIGGWGWVARAGEPRRGPQRPDEEAEVRALAKQAGLPELRSSRSEHYLGVGDAPDAHREQALKICEELAVAYRKHFHEKGFGVTFPERPLTLVVLAGAKSYAAFAGQAPGPDEAGHFDVDTNRLVIFDLRTPAADLSDTSRRYNLFALVHEGLHQLTFNTGLLNRRGDVPVALSEGLATYGELWRPGRHSTLAQVNRPRLEILLKRQGQELDWIPLRTLLTDDGLFQGSSEQLAYAQAWALVYELMTLPRRSKFRAYLAALSDRIDPARRLVDAETHLGNLDRLDRDLRRHTLR